MLPDRTLSVSYPTDRSLQPRRPTAQPGRCRCLSVSYPTDRSLQRDGCAWRVSCAFSFQYPTLRIVLRNNEPRNTDMYVHKTFQYPTLRIVLCNLTTGLTLVRSTSLSVSYPTDRSLQPFSGRGGSDRPFSFQYPTLRIVLCNRETAGAGLRPVRPFQYPTLRIVLCNPALRS